MAVRWWMASPAAGVILAAFACTTSGNGVTPPTPIPLVLNVTPVAHQAVAQQNTSAQGDSATVSLTGDGAANASWSVTRRHAWTMLTTATGTGAGMVRWTRDISGLVVGIYVDTLTVNATGASGSPLLVYDTLTITAAQVPLTLDLSPIGQAVTVTAGATSAPAGEAAVTIAGAGADSIHWNATKRRATTTLSTLSGMGSGAVRWTRNPSGLTVGDYVDTITVTAGSITGSPKSVFDTLHVVPAPVPLTLVVAPAARVASVQVGGTAPADSATVTLAGDGAAAAAWTATKRQAWITLTTASGAGSGLVRWSRNANGLAVETYVDTITVTAAGATGSPALVFDTLRVTASSGGPTADLGVVASLHGKRIFPVSDPWNQPVDTAQVDPNSAAILATIGVGKSFHPDWGPTWGFPYIIVPDTLTRVPVAFDYASESDPGPYPIPPNPPIESGGDAHLLVITQNEWKLYELYALQSMGPGQWSAGSGAIFDLTNGTQRPAGWTSADAAGLPIFPGLVRYDEVYELGEITHALRMTVAHTRRAYIPPATHWASSSTNPSYLPMGARVRLRADFDISGYPSPMQVILRALKKYGLIVADNGSDFFVSGTIDSRWNDTFDNLLKQVTVGDFEVIRMVGVVAP